MITSKNNKFTVFYDRGVSDSFLVIDISETENIYDYQIDMIQSNPQIGILPMHLQKIDNKFSIYYNVTSKISLTQFLARNTLDKNRFVTLILNIVKTICDSKNYLLSDNNFIIDKDYIYIDPETYNTYLLYIPAAIEQDNLSKFKSFLIDIITRSANIDESDNDNFIQKIINFTKQEPFDISQFNDLLKQLKTETISMHSLDTDKKIQSNSFEIRSSITPIQPKIDPSNIKSNAFDVPNPLQKIESNATTVPKIKKKASIELKPSKKTTYIIGLQVIIAMLIIFILSSGIISNLDDPTSEYIGLFIIIFALDFLLIKKIMKINDLTDIKHEDHSRISINTIIHEEQEFHILKSSNNNINLENPENQKRSILTDKTELLCNNQSSKVCPYLKQIKDDTSIDDSTEILITKSSFIIGRLPSQVDYICKDNTIGKIHAEIITRNFEFFIKDLNSRNGTFINGEKIVPNTEYKIKNNDKISFANCNFIFILN